MLGGVGGLMANSSVANENETDCDNDKLGNA